MRRQFKTHDETESSNEGACVRYLMNRNRQEGGVCKIYDEPESPHEGVCFRYMVNRNRQTRGRVSDI